MKLDFSTLLTQYRSELLDRTIPFWIQYGVDWQNGGICTCISDQGKILSTDKYLWSQLRAIWTFAALYNRIEPRQGWLDIAEHIFAFVKQYGRDAHGNWLFRVSQDGTPLQGATSIYADGFAIYGLTELAKATGNAQVIQLARETYANVSKKIARPGSYQTDPHPIPAGLQAHGVPMIFSLVFSELGAYLGDSAISDAGQELANQVMTVFRHPEKQRLYEFVTLENALLDAPPGRTINPGHAIESMWFMIHIHQQRGDPMRVRQAIECIRWHLELGWDYEFGGLFLARDAEGSSWEKSASTKIWWPHTEALYALLLAYSISQEPWCLEWFARVNDYAFAHFPVSHYGEWIQNLDRSGKPITTVVGLPVKDPFHLARSLINSIRVLEQLVSTEPGLSAKPSF